MPKVRRSERTTIKGNPPVIKVDLTGWEHSVHLGPFMPFNSAGSAPYAISSNHVIRTNTTIVLSTPKKARK